MSDQPNTSNNEEENKVGPSLFGESASEGNQKGEIKDKAKGLFESAREFLYDTVDITHDTDKEQTVKDITDDISYKGHTVWILICSVFIASFGLNANSIPVVIGAMLISPLMGPILGIGMSVALNDIDTLRRSLINFAIMVGFSILTAYLFFMFFPIKDASSELLARTRPDIRDVMIAFFGGLALAIAKTKKGSISSVVYGVAIATALMPPLCTAGYGLAVEGIFSKFFYGAMYLFFINTMFIALATYIVLKLLRFPMVKYANSIRRKQIARLVSISSIVVMGPALYIFYTVYQSNKFDNAISLFVNEDVKSNKELYLYAHDADFDKKALELTFLNQISPVVKEGLAVALNKYDDLKDVSLSVKGSGINEAEVIKEAYDDARERIKEKDNIIDGLQQQINSLKIDLDGAQSAGFSTIPFAEISNSAKINYSGLESFAYSNILRNNFDLNKIDTIPIVMLKWNIETLKDSSLVISQEERMKTWLKQRLKRDSIFIHRIPPN